jgi:outer membrane protein TolC
MRSKKANKTMYHKLLLSFVFFCKIVCTTMAQDNATQVFSYQQFIVNITSNHPILKQASGINDQAKADLLIAKGSFDPKLEVNFDRKYFEGKSYFNFWDNQLKIPLYWAGIDIKAGFERNIGDVLGSDIKTPLDGVSYMGIQIPLGQRLLIDERRATLQNVQIFQQMADNERVKVVNKLILSAAKTYWDWYAAHQNEVLLNDFYQLAQQRYQLTQKRILGGDLPAIDSADAQVTLLDRQVMLNQASVEVNNARLLVSNYLWDSTLNPLEVPINAIPQTTGIEQFNNQKLSQLLTQAEQNHPDILKLTYKAQQLKTDEKLAKEMRKPRLDIGLSSLNYAHRLFSTTPTVGGFFQQNYKFNVDVAFPLFFRKERGKLQSVQIKQWQNELEIKQNQREIQNEIKIAYNDLKTLEEQLKNQQIAIERQSQVLKIEEKRFNVGESSLFLVNQREAKLIELKQKLALMKAKYEKAKATLLFAAGLSE